MPIGNCRMALVIVSVRFPADDRNSQLSSRRGIGKLAIGNWQSAMGNRQLAIGNGPSAMPSLAGDQSCQQCSPTRYRTGDNVFMVSMSSIAIHAQPV